MTKHSERTTYCNSGIWVKFIGGRYPVYKTQLYSQMTPNEMLIKTLCLLGNDERLNSYAHL